MPLIFLIGIPLGAALAYGSFYLVAYGPCMFGRGCVAWPFIGIPLGYFTSLIVFPLTFVVLSRFIREPSTVY
ncbi:hypothetical protein BH10PSE17_BH10PSE17_26750 [soil metagenome]